MSTVKEIEDYENAKKSILLILKGFTVRTSEQILSSVKMSLPDKSIVVE